MIYIAIDPGLTGALAAIDDDAQLVLCADLPVIRDNKLAWIDSNELTGLFQSAWRHERISAGIRASRGRHSSEGRGCNCADRG
jgi:hypothetical protein